MSSDKSNVQFTKKLFENRYDYTYTCFQKRVMNLLLNIIRWEQ